MSANLRWLLGLLLRQRRLLAGALFFMAIQALATASYPVFLDLLTTRIIGQGPGASAAIREALVRLGLEGSSLEGWLTKHLLVAFVAVVLLKGLAQAARALFVGRLGQALAHDLRYRAFSRLVGQDPAFFAARSSGDLLSRVLVDVERAERAAVLGIPVVVGDVLRILGLVVGCIALYPELSLRALGILPLSLLPIVVLGRLMRRRAEAAQRAVGAIGARLAEMMAGHWVTSSFRLEALERARFHRVSLELARAEMGGIALRAAHSPLMEMIGAAAVVVTVSFASAEVGAGRMRPGEVVGFLLALILIYEPLKAIGRTGGVLWAGLAAGGRLLELLNRAPAIRDASDARELLGPIRAVAFGATRVRYLGAEVDALSALDLELSGPGLYALVGPSGSGKSTALALVNRLLDPTSGRLSLDGLDVARVRLVDVRRCVAVADQGAHLFDATILENLCVEDTPGGRARAESACRAAGAHEFVVALPSGYDTPVGERGVRLSLGERQRIAVARALASEASVLVLDEPTSHLDPDSRARIHDALRQEARGRIVLVATHDEALVALADRVIELERARGGEPARRGVGPAAHDEGPAAHDGPLA